MSQRNSNFFLLTLVLASAVLALLRFDSLQIGTSYDDAKYIILAESLSSGQGYELINFPRPQIERNFPPGWPLILAPFTLILQQDYEALKVVSLALWMGSIFLVYKLFSKRLASPSLELLIAVVALNPLLVGTSVTLMSESAYLFFSLLALLAFDKAGEKNLGWLIFAAILAFYTQQVRTVGISLTISLLVVLSLSRRFKEMGLVAVIFVVGFAFQGWLNLRSGGSVISSGYEAQVLSGSSIEKINQIWENASGYFDQVLAGSLIPIFGTRLDASFGWLFVLFNIGVLLMLMVGLFTLRPKFEWMNIYFVVYLAGILAFWNPQVGNVKARFLIPILPFLYYYFLNGLKWLTRENPRIVIGISAVVALVLLARNFQDWRSPVHNQMTDLSIGTSWVAENAPVDAIVMVNEPVPAYVHVKRKTINFPKNGQGLERYLENQGIDYIVIAPSLRSPRSTDLGSDIARIEKELAAAPGKYKLVFEDSSENVRVYQFMTGE